jgi:hypothetical protein
LAIGLPADSNTAANFARLAAGEINPPVASLVHWPFAVFGHPTP